MKKERYCFYKDQSYQEAYPRLGETFQFIYFFFFLNSFVYFHGCTGSLQLCMGFLQLWQAEAALQLLCGGLSFLWFLLLQSTGSRLMGFSSHSVWAQQLWLQGSRVLTQQLWCSGLAGPWHVGSSQTRNQTCVHGIGRRIPHH